MKTLKNNKTKDLLIWKGLKYESSTDYTNC